MISFEEWNARIDAFMEEENEKKGSRMPVHRIYCQDDSDRSGGGLYNETVTVDTIGRFARALGDSNPLYSAPEYAQRSVWKGIVAPPLLECCICSTFIGGRMPRLRGLQVFDAGTRWERFVPIRPGDTFSAVTTWKGVEDITKPGKEANARLLLRSHEIDLYNQRGDHVSRLTARSIIKCTAPGEKQRRAEISAAVSGNTQKIEDKSDRQTESGQTECIQTECIQTECMQTECMQTECTQTETMQTQTMQSENLQRAGEGFNGHTENRPAEAAQTAGAPERRNPGGRPRYSEAQLNLVYGNLEAQLRGDFRRGSAVRHLEDVKIGEDLPAQIVGPYDESDGQSLMAAIGAANAFATKWGTIRGRRGTGGIVDPETGARRHPVDRHISDAAARAQGLPRAIVSGIHTQALLAKAVSDWMGDAGSLRTLDCRCRRPLYYGDLSIQRGRVLRRYLEGGNRYALLFMEAVNQEGIVHTDALAYVILPS